MKNSQNCVKMKKSSQKLKIFLNLVKKEKYVIIIITIRKICKKCVKFAKMQNKQRKI